MIILTDNIIFHCFIHLYNFICVTNYTSYFIHVITMFTMLSLYIISCSAVISDKTLKNFSF